MIKSVCIVGCGWFGLPLAKALVAHGVTVFGSKRELSQALALKELGIDGFRLDLDDDVHLQDDSAEITQMLATDCLIINIPPGLRKAPDAYLQRLTNLKQLIGDHSYKKLIFVSTTGVYPSIEGMFTECVEQDAKAHSEISEKLLQAEALFVDNANACIVRFAGLVGPKRHPGRFLAGKTGLPGANSAVNLVHLNDCIVAVTTLLFNPAASTVYNVCAPNHPTRQGFYPKAASDLGLAAPQFVDDGVESKLTGKSISSDRLIIEFSFEYQFSDPMDMLTAC
ncbi:NAD-dependent epimerase/dehydratase [Shewanella halifaxensis HAW-EB4]|uniref:NAD-dependent epimerase/dehydratase n=1 Tax=Shewanella halifaxensis (strain HAW-EB4) TaxID=458817 RepID=B0TKA9_SHEHH|nr:SDR family oxidoreductase [Shewanella halifaxensis]ABZ77128.1 NAD-dependent epimerase/dehydratase [Shewanella halifaxensis HAW-EB4]